MPRTPCAKNARVRLARLGLVGSLLLLPGAPARAEAEPGGRSDAESSIDTGAATAPRRWDLAITPYLWATFADAELVLGDEVAGVSATAGDILSGLQVGFMGIVNGRYDRFVARVDTLWARIATGNETGPYGSGVSLEQVVVDTKLGYRLAAHRMTPPLWNPAAEERLLAFDLLAGFRWWYLGIDGQVRLPGTIPYLGLPLRSVETWWDPILGVRLIVPLAPAVTATLEGDVGGFDIGAGSDFTWSVVGSLDWHLSERWTVSLAGKALDVKRAGDLLTYYGPALGVTYSF